MRKSIQEVFDIFCGQDVYIIGGGNSLKGFDFSRLKDKKVIATNAAYRYVDNKDAILFWMDESWADEQGSDLENHPSKFRFTSSTLARRSVLEDSEAFHGARYLYHSGEMGYDPNVDNVKGNNSGTQAVNFAINLQPRKIILLGFDMGASGTPTHFHKHHRNPTPISVYPELFIPSINALAKESEYRKVPIINCSPVSKLTCFKRGDIEKHL
jgi:hypothetical protein